MYDKLNKLTYVLTMARIDCKSSVLILIQTTPSIDVILISSVVVRNLVSGCRALMIVFTHLLDKSDVRLSSPIWSLIFTLCFFNVYIVCTRSYFIVAFWTIPNSQSLPIKFY